MLRSSLFLILLNLISGSLSKDVCSCLIFAGDNYDVADIHGHEYLKNELSSRTVQCHKSDFQECQRSCAIEFIQATNDLTLYQPINLVGHRYHVKLGQLLCNLMGRNLENGTVISVAKLECSKSSITDMFFGKETNLRKLFKATGHRVKEFLICQDGHNVVDPRYELFDVNNLKVDQSDLNWRKFRIDLQLKPIESSSHKGWIYAVFKSGEKTHRVVLSNEQEKFTEGIEMKYMIPLPFEAAEDIESIEFSWFNAGLLRLPDNDRSVLMIDNIHIGSESGIEQIKFCGDVFVDLITANKKPLLTSKHNC